MEEVGAEEAVGAEDDDEADVVAEGEVGDGGVDVVLEVVGVGLELEEGGVGGHGSGLEEGYARGGRSEVCRRSQYVGSNKDAGVKDGCVLLTGWGWGWGVGRGR